MDIRDLEAQLPPHAWVLEDSDGPPRLYASAAIAKSDAERLAGHPLNWAPFAFGAEAALDDEENPETSTAYTVTPMMIRTASRQQDTVQFPAPEPSPGNEDTRLLADVYRVLAHEAYHGTGASRDCPLCEISPDPKMDPAGWEA
jgi:hypothetical protein